MDRRQVALALTLDQLKWRPDLAVRADRVRLQHVVFLLQRGGVGLGYRYRWKSIGPYSSDLDDDAATLAVGSPRFQDEGWALHPDAVSRVGRLTLLVAGPLKRAESSRELETLAVVAFLVGTRQAEPTESRVAKAIAASGRPETAADIAQAIRVLRDHGLCSTGAASANSVNAHVPAHAHADAHGVGFAF